MRRIAWLGMGMLLASAASGQTVPRPITLEEAVSLAQQNAPSIIQAEGQSRTSSAGVRSAYAAFIPTFSLSAGATRQVPSGPRTRVDNGTIVVLPAQPWSSNIGMGANVLLFEGGGRFFDLRQAKAQERSADANEITQRFGATLVAKQQYFNVLAARESEAAAAAQLEEAEQQRKVSIARTRAKEATRSDSLRAEIQVRNAQVAQVDARTALESANASLTRAIGADRLVTAAGLPDSLDVPTLAVDDAGLRDLTLRGPGVQSAQAQLDAAKAAATGSWTDYLPSLSASYSRSGSTVGDTPTFNGTDFDYSGAVRFSLSMPIFTQLQRESQVVQAQVARDNAEAALHDQRLAALETLVQQVGAFRSAANRVAVQIATVEAAEEDLRVQQQRYSVGGSTLLDVLSSHSQLDQARRDLIRARYDQRVAKAQLEALVGRDL